jgi:uncharacterized protein (DUF2141 family)
LRYLLAFLAFFNMISILNAEAMTSAGAVINDVTLDFDGFKNQYGLSKLCCSIVKAVLQYFQSCAAVLLKQCCSVVKAVLQLCQSCAAVLSKLCCSIVRAVLQYC